MCCVVSKYVYSVQIKIEFPSCILTTAVSLARIGPLLVGAHRVGGDVGRVELSAVVVSLDRDRRLHQLGRRGTTRL